jgi:sialidase-1
VQQIEPDAEHVLFRHEDEDWYRIVSLAVTPEGTVLAFSGQRKGSVADFGHETDMVVRRSTDGGQSFGPPETIAHESRTDIHSGPVVVDRERERILKFCRFWPAENGERVVRTTQYYHMAKMRQIDHVVISEDDGETWRKPKRLELPFPDDSTSAATGNGVHGIQLGSGRLLIQAGFCMGLDLGTGQRYDCVLYSDDGGENWDRGATARFDSIREFCMADPGDGRIYYNFRNHEGGGHRKASWGEPDGLTFGQVTEEPQLPEPVCHAGLTSVPPGEGSEGDDRPLVFCNPNVVNESGKYSAETRRELALRVSTDRGRTWSDPLVLWPERAGYSDLAADENGNVHCIYERGPDGGTYHDEVAYARVRLSDLL